MEIAIFVAGGLVAAAAGVIGLLLAGRRARRRFEEHVGTCHARMVAADRQLAAVDTRAAAYPRDLPAPFAPLRRDLDAALAHARTGTADLHARRRALLQGVGRPEPGARLPRPLAFVSSLDELRRWRRLDTDSAGVETMLAEMEAGVEAAIAALARLEAVPADTGGAIARLLETARQATALADEVAARGAHGAPLDLATTVARDLAGRLGTASTVTPRDTVAAYELVELLAVPVAEVHAQLAIWADDGRHLEQALDDAHGALDDAGRRIAALPPAVDGTGLLRRLEVLRQNLRAIDQEATHAEVRALAGITLRACDVAGAAGILADDADSAAHRQIEFAAHYRRARALLARASLEMQAAAGEVIYPIDWRAWAGRCAAAERALAMMGNPLAPRAPEALEGDGAVAARMAKEAAELIETVTQARNQREALRRLLQQPALAPDRPWEARASALYAATGVYAAENWPTADRVPYLRDDAASLADQHARWVPPEPWQPLAVDTLDRRLDAVARLAGALQAFEPALARIEEALARLRAAEAGAREGLAGCRQEMAHLVDTLRTGYDRPVTRHLGALHLLIQQGEAIEASFSRRDRGTVAARVQRVTRWARAARARLKPLCRALEVAATDGRASLAADMEAFTHALRLDAEPAVRTAAARVAAPRPARPKVHGDPLARAAADVAYAVALAADRRANSQALHDLAAATGALTEPLRAWHTARDEAEAAWDRLEAARQALAGGWPPMACDSGRPGRLHDTARHARDEARYEEERHLAGARRVPEATARLHSLAEAYRRAAAAATEATVAAHQAHARVQAAVDALDAALVRAPSSEVEHEIDRLRRGWTRRPPAEDEAIRELERLRHKLGL